MRCQSTDRITLDLASSKRVKTPEGYLSAPATMGRCGIQVYTRGELGLDGDASAPVRLMRLPEEVFRPETIASFENKPITYRHPVEGVDADTWPELAKGHVRDVAKNPGDLLCCTAWVMDGEQVARVESGDAELSCGYSFDLDLTPGKTAAGEAFDGYQRKILGDHLAILDAYLDSPRGGPACRIQDRKENNTMKRIVKTSDGLVVGEFEEPQASAVESHLQRIEKERDQAVSDLAASVASARKATDAIKVLLIDGKQSTPSEAMARIASDAGKIADLQKKILTDAQLDAMIETRAVAKAAVTSAADALGVKVEMAGKTLPQARKAILAAAVDSDEQTKLVVKSVLGDTEIAKADDAVVATLLGTLSAQAKTRTGDLRAQDEAVIRAMGGGAAPTKTADGHMANDGKVLEVDLENNEHVLLPAAR